jgi:phosphatidylglycerophosphate synthase
MSIQKQNNVSATYKSNDTEEWLDTVWTRPIGYLWAKFFAKCGVHPNTVTVLSMILGAASAYFFAQGSLLYDGLHGVLMNLIGVLLLAWANFYDSADGQLARMTNQKTQLGRILDGASSDVWFIPIYSAIVIRLYSHHAYLFPVLGIVDNERNSLIFAIIMFFVALYSGFGSHARQCALADYYRQIHLFFVKGETGSELDSYTQQKRLYEDTPWKGNLLWKFFLRLYVNYTKNQEARTPRFQQLREALELKYGGLGQVPESFRKRFREGSLPLMPFTNILTFNTRAIVLYLSCLGDAPWFYFVFEIVFMGLLCHYMWHQHEQLCKDLLKEL